MMIFSLILRLAAGTAVAAVELPARSSARAVEAPMPLLWTPSEAALGLAFTPTLSAAATPSLPAAPVVFSAAPLDLSRAAGVYERRGVGLLVLDAKDSTALHLSEGTRKAHAMIRDVIDDAEAAASSFDGVVIRRLGDGSLIAFPSYAAALGAAEAIQTSGAGRRDEGVPGPELRVGVHAGRVLVDATGAAPEIYGAAVEKTLKLAASAEGGEIAVDPASRGSAAEPVRAADAPRPISDLRIEQAATMFAGLDGWSTAFDRYGRRRAYAAVKTFHAHVRAAVERHGGIVVKNEGETVMASFPSAAAAIKAAADIQGRMEELRAAAPLGKLFRARVGVGWGRVIREQRGADLDYFGNTVNAAARLMRLAGDGEALVSGTAAAEPGAGALLEGAAREKTRMKGFDGEVSVLRLKPAPQPRDLEAEAILAETARRARANVVSPK